MIIGLVCGDCSQRFRREVGGHGPLPRERFTCPWCSNTRVEPDPRLVAACEERLRAIMQREQLRAMPTSSYPTKDPQVSALLDMLARL